MALCRYTYGKGVMGDVVVSVVGSNKVQTAKVMTVHCFVCLLPVCLTVFSLFIFLPSVYSLLSWPASALFVLYAQQIQSKSAAL